MSDSEEEQSDSDELTSDSDSEHFNGEKMDIYMYLIDIIVTGIVDKLYYPDPFAGYSKKDGDIVLSEHCIEFLWREIPHIMKKEGINKNVNYITKEQKKKISFALHPDKVDDANWIDGDRNEKIAKLTELFQNFNQCLQANN